MNRDALQTLLARHHQEHLLAFWDRLAPAAQAALAEQIQALDFELLARLHALRAGAEDVRTLAGRAESPDSIRLQGPNRFTAEEARQRGRAALAAGKLGVILVAGGQGTRLGFPQPKGMYAIGPVSQHALFQIHVEKILASARRYGVRIPLYLMTSPATHAETQDYFRAVERFGLPADDLVIFCQGTMPAVDETTGRVLLDQPHRVAVSPDGHGGMLAALDRSGALADIRRRAIDDLFYFQVDNPLATILDPEFLGYHLLAQSDMTTQVIAKREPLEKVGNFVTVDGRARVIEYSDLPDDVARRRAADGSLAIWAGSIGIHALRTAFLERMAHQAGGLPFHLARKKVPYVDASGRRIEPSQPNAIKFERFIFDLLPSARNALAVEVDPAKAFAPLKNAPGEKFDTPESVREQMIALHRAWLAQAGVEVARGVAVEIGPLFALDADEVRQRVPAGTTITAAKYFGN